MGSTQPSAPGKRLQSLWQLIVATASRRSTLFFIWMTLASGFGFLKVLLLAQILEPDAFGHYVTIFGAATLSGTLFSFGAVESTIKHYPRLWVENRFEDIRADASRVIMRLAGSFGSACIIAAGLIQAFGFVYSLQVIMLAGAFGLTTALLSLTASILRASSSPKVLQNFQFSRSLLALIGASVGAYLASWQGALGGEVACAILSLILGRLDIMKLFRRQVAQPHTELTQATQLKSGGRTLYFSNILSTAPFLTDRAMINAALGPATAGSYGVIAMIFQIGVLISNILTQWAGADIIKAAHLGNRRAGNYRLVGKYFSLLSGMILALVCVVLLLKELDLPPGFFAKYNISNLAIVLGGAIGVTQIYALLEFVLIAEDRENLVFSASLISAIVFYSSFALAWQYGLPLEGFLSFAFTARCLHIVLLTVFIAKSNKASIGSTENKLQEDLR